MLMHAQGDPKTMNDNPQYSDVVLDVFDYLEGRIARLRGGRHPARQDRRRSGHRLRQAPAPQRRRPGRAVALSRARRAGAARRLAQEADRPSVATCPIRSDRVPGSHRRRPRGGRPGRADHSRARRCRNPAGARCLARCPAWHGPGARLICWELPRGFRFFSAAGCNLPQQDLMLGAAGRPSIFQRGVYHTHRRQAARVGYAI